VSLEESGLFVDLPIRRERPGCGGVGIVICSGRHGVCVGYEYWLSKRKPFGARLLNGLLVERREVTDPVCRVGARSQSLLVRTFVIFAIFC